MRFRDAAFVKVKLYYVVVMFLAGIWQTILSMGIAGFVGIILGGLIVVILLIVCIVCTCRR